MVEHDRRNVLKYAGLAMTGGALATGSTVADTTGSGTGVNGIDGSAAESRGWSSIGGNAGNNPVVSADDAPETPVTVAWEYDQAGPAAVVDGTVYLTTNGEVHALDAADGSVEWRTDAIGASGTPAVADDTVYVGGERLTVIDAANGDLCCQHDLGYDEDIASPVVADGRVLTVGDGTLYALDAAERELAWEFTPDGDPLYEQPVAVGGDAAVAVSESRAFARELADGTERWRLDEPVGDDEHSRFAKPSHRQTSFPVATDDVVAIGSADTEPEAMWPLGYTTLYDVETGEQRVSSARAAFDPAAITDERLYALESHNARGHDRETGEEGWDTAVSTYQVSSLAIGDGTVYAGLTIDGEAYGPGEAPEDENGVYAFDSETGEVEWSVGTDDIPTIAVTDGTIYASSETLVAIRTEGDDRDAESADGEGNEDETDGESDGEADGNGTESDSSDSTDGNDTGESSTGGANESASGAGNGSETGNGSGDGDLGEGNVESEADSNEESEGMPGFTAGAGVVGAAAGIEALRRRTDTDETDETDE
ncbi:PQQ-binding-like beta-propeller repeat protein [Natrialba sp. PRR66]|uniref:outer membrane protein assembly factor BamB family protein n=1 Tax=Natrialba sp. PRR66 TaxID=3098146 RepID=UPI002B1CF0F4|nr:PQQ-binding-like beta-propeller repeat protein [Natrialba sp. PRR66]